MLKIQVMASCVLSLLILQNYAVSASHCWYCCTFLSRFLCNIPCIHSCSNDSVQSAKSFVKQAFRTAFFNESLFVCALCSACLYCWGGISIPIVQRNSSQQRDLIVLVAVQSPLLQKAGKEERLQVGQKWLLSIDTAGEATFSWEKLGR